MARFRRALEILKLTHGGARKGAGMPKGTKLATTVTKEAAREVARLQIMAELQPLIAAQIANAKGLSYLVTRDKKTGKFIRVGPAMAGQVGEETIEVWEKDPSVQAFTDLLNRALDKPAEQEQHIDLSGGLKIIHVLGDAD
jgi:hypothetical protein